MNKKVLFVALLVVVAVVAVAVGWGRFAPAGGGSSSAAPAPTIDDDVPEVPPSAGKGGKVNPEDDRAPYPGEAVGDGEPGEPIETVEGGRLELPDNVSEQEWRKAVESAEKVATDFVSVALAMNKGYADPYSGYRVAYRKGLCSKKVVDEHDPRTLSVSDKRDWKGMVDAGITAEAEVDFDSTLLGGSGKADPDSIVLYVRVNTSLYDNSQLHSTDVYGYTVTVVRDGDRRVVDSFVEGAEPLGL